MPFCHQLRSVGHCPGPTRTRTISKDAFLAHRLRDGLGQQVTQTAPDISPYEKMNEDRGRNAAILEQGLQASGGNVTLNEPPCKHQYMHRCSARRRFVAGLVAYWP